MKDCIEQDTTKAVKQYMNMTNGQTTGITKIFKVNYVSITLQCLKIIFKQSQIEWFGFEVCSCADTY